MARVTESALRCRLARVDALHRRATTPGERTAAAMARERLLRRIDEVRRSDPIARFCAAHIASLGVAPTRRWRVERVPSQRELLRVLALWQASTWTDQQVYAWASRWVDRVTLPADPRNEAACRAEVLLQLASHERVPLRVDDVPGVRSFLATRDWAAWFALVAAASGTAAGQGGP